MPDTDRTPVAREIETTPFVSTLQFDLDEAARELLRLPASVPMVCRRNTKSESTHIMIGEGDDRLELDFRHGGQSGWFVGQHFSASYRGL
ncbi:MAG: hypothetical protein ACJAYU_001241 [Bradymonadia bacterium]|jgi:hypothetical protein